jgi:hypothetical protein
LWDIVGQGIHQGRIGEFLPQQVELFLSHWSQVAV